MNKIISTILVIGLFFTLTLNVKAQSVAGNSAGLAIDFAVDKSVSTSTSLNIKRMVIRSVLEKNGSTMVNDVDSFIDACTKYNLDCYLLPSISGVESTFGRFIAPGTHNPFGWGRGITQFNSWSEAIDTVGRGLREDYINKWKAQNIDEIGRIYCEGNTWSGKVTYFMNQFQAEENKILLFSVGNPVQL